MPDSRAAAYRLNWNPSLAPDDVTEHHVRDLEQTGSVDIKWHCGNARIEKGQRLYLVRTGTGPRGIIGAGRALDVPERRRRDERGEWVPGAVNVRFDVLSLTPIVTREKLDEPPLDEVHWSLVTPAAKLNSDQAACVETLLRNAKTSSPPGDADVGPQSGSPGWRSDPEHNARVEKAAVKCVTDWYARAGYLVRSVETERLGYDLLCTKGSQVIHVEVKGASMEIEAFVLTANERHCLEHDPHWLLVTVVDALGAPRMNRYTAEAFHTTFTATPLSYRVQRKVVGL